MSMHHIFKAITLSAAALFAQSALSQTYPSKPITVVVPYSAGGVSDFVARFMTKEMATTLKQPMLVDNVAGVGGALGTMKVLNAPADGHTILVGSVTELILTPLANSNAKYSPKDFKTVAMLGQADIMLVARKDLAANTLDEFIALAKKSADKPLSYCTVGIGSQYHLIGEKFAAIAGTKALHVPYKAFPDCVTNLVGQQVDYAFLPVAGPFPGFVDKGNLKLIAMVANTINSKFPKAPLFKNSKGFESFVFPAWIGIQVSNKVPDDVVLAINKSAMAAIETPEVKAQFAASGSIIYVPMSPRQAQAYFMNEVTSYQEIAKSINLQQQ